MIAGPVDPLKWVVGTVGADVLVAAALEFGHSRFGDGRTEFDRRTFALVSGLAVLLLCVERRAKQSWPEPQ